MKYQYSALKRLSMYKVGHQTLGISLMFLVAFLGTVDALLVRLLASDVHPLFMVFTRASFGLLVFLPWLKNKKREMLKVERFWLHALRAVLKIIALSLLFYALANASLAAVTTISFAAPFFVMGGAWLFLSEKLKLVRVLSLLIGFFGITVVLNPLNEEINYFLIFALLSAIFTSVILLILKYMGRRDNADSLVIWNLIITIPLSAIPAFYVWEELTILHWFLLFFQGVVGSAAQFIGTRAFQLADASLIAPVDFVRLPMVSFAAYFFFYEYPNFNTILGAFLIFVALILLSCGEVIKEKFKKKLIKIVFFR